MAILGEDFEDLMQLLDWLLCSYMMSEKRFSFCVP